MTTERAGDDQARNRHSAQCGAGHLGMGHRRLHNLLRCACAGLGRELTRRASARDQRADDLRDEQRVFPLRFRLRGGRRGQLGADGHVRPVLPARGIDTVELVWTITGGTEPYEVSVQGQTLLSGPTGSTLVYCAESLPYGELDFGLSRDDYDRTELDDPPEVNPGPITFEATVKDADGQKAKAKVRTYVVVNCDDYCDYEVLPEGYTVRLFGTLMPIPKGLKISCCEYSVAHAHDGHGNSGTYYDLGLVGKGGGSIRFTENGRFLGYH